MWGGEVITYSVLKSKGTVLPQEVKYEFECCLTAKTDEKSRRFERDNNEFLSIKIYVQISFFCFLLFLQKENIGLNFVSILFCNSVY